MVPDCGSWPAWLIVPGGVEHQVPDEFTRSPPRRATFTRRDLIRAVASHALPGISRAQLGASVDWILADSDAVQPLPPPLREGKTEPEAMLRWTETGRDLRNSTPEMVSLELGVVFTAKARAAGWPTPIRSRRRVGRDPTISER